jgi:hypothetical protein
VLLSCLILLVGSAPNLLRFIPPHLMLPSQQALRDSSKSLGQQGFATENGILRSLHQHCNNMAFQGFQVSANKQMPESSVELYGSCFRSFTLTLSGRMSICNQHGYSASTDKCRYMIDKGSFSFLQSYVDHMSLLATIYCPSAFMNVSFGCPAI